MPTENERVVSEFCQTWTTLDIDKVMEFFTDDAVYHNIPLAAARGKAEIRKINVARDQGVRLEVAAGVHAGERVILNPPASLVDGSKVQVAAQ